MGFKTKEQQKEYNRQYYQKTRLKQLEDKKLYYQNNRESRSQYNKNYREKNREKLKQYTKEWYDENKDTKVKDYRESENGMKLNKKSDWKRHGLNMENFDEIYDIHTKITHCESCGCELTNDKTMTPTTKCMDHNHITGYYRNTICNCCNIRRGHIDKNHLNVMKELKSIINIKSVILKYII